ncbi:class I SAM-dependent methyltransferase [uncultured Planktosalinus sp.]|uniref:O-methyltransferase n=1 Tax=uncultured Planktosalinus sp. TaxID=1810935 RepID=UPI0030D984B4
MYLIFSYIKFFFKSIKLHGVHSPFVYDLINQCFKDKESYPEYKSLENYTKNLTHCKEILLVKEFGSGSRVFRSNKRKVSAIARHAAISNKRQQLLFRLTRFFNFQNTLELGTSLGKATIAFALSKNNHVISVEGCRATASFTQKALKQAGCSNAEVIIEPFESFLNNKIDNLIDCIYIDGNHTYKDTINYFQKLLPVIHNNSLMIFDDIYWSAEMQRAWKEIAAHPKVTVAIDTFQWGIVSFRKEQKKETFTIRL